MLRRIGLVLSLVAPFVAYGQPPAVSAQARAVADAPAADRVPRAIRRDVPLTNSIRRAYEAGTRDATGRPGPNYWQLQTDYTISARLDPATQTITGTETITLHNNSPAGADARSCCGWITTSSAASCRAACSVPAENTEGMVVTRLARQRRGRGSGRASAERRRTRPWQQRAAPS